MNTPTTAQKLAAAKKLAIAHQHRIRKEGAAAAIRILSTPRSAFGKFKTTPRHVPGVLQGSRAETKSVDMPVSASDPVTNIISTTATFTLLTAVQEGSSFYNRIGRKIMLRSIHLTGQISINEGAALGNNNEYLRIMIVYDRQTNGAFPTISDVLTDYDNAGATTTTSFSHLNMNNAERFVMLRDIRIVVPLDTGVSTPGNTAQIMAYDGNKCNINEFIRLKDMETHYKASSNPAVVGDITTGGLYLITFGNVAAAAAGYELIWNARLRYHDV